MKYCNDIINFLFGELWEYLTITIKNHSINLQEIFMLICLQITHVFIRILQRKLFWVIWIGLATHTPKMIVFIWRILWCLSASKKWTSSPTFFWRYCKDMQTCYSTYFGQAWLRTGKFNAYLHVKFKLQNSLLSWDINFARYGIGGKISMIISVFIQDFLGEKIK